MMNMLRSNLITKEKVKKAAEGKLKDDEDWKHYKGSINDDLERFFINLQDENEIKEEGVSSFFAPKLTNEEMKLIKEGNKEHLTTYLDNRIIGLNPDVDLEEMKKSNSKSKYLHVNVYRWTIPLTLEIIETKDGLYNKAPTVTYLLAMFRVEHRESMQVETKAAQPSKETLISSSSKVEEE